MANHWNTEMSDRRRALIERVREEMPDRPRAAQARWLNQKDPLLFPSEHSARLALQHRAGRAGKRSPRAQDPPRTQSSWPESKAAIWEPYVLPKAANNILVLSDIHIPYHDVTALDLAVEYGHKHKVNAVLINGDLLDMYQLGTFAFDPTRPTPAEELAMGHEFLKSLKKKFPGKPIYYKLGNHEERWERTMWANPKFAKIPGFKIEEVLRCGELGVPVISEKRRILAGKLNIMHGHELDIKHVPVNPARSVVLKAKVSTIVGHWHQVAEHTFKNLNGTIETCWSTGCMCELTPAYRPVNEWSLGFAHVLIGKNGSFDVRNIRIVEGKIR